MSGLEKFKVPIIILAVVAVGAVIFMLTKGGGGGDAPVNDVTKQATDMTKNVRPGDPDVPPEKRTGVTMGSQGKGN